MFKNSHFALIFVFSLTTICLHFWLLIIKINFTEENRTWSFDCQWYRTPNRISFYLWISCTIDRWLNEANERWTMVADDELWPALSPRYAQHQAYCASRMSLLFIGFTNFSRSNDVVSETSEFGTTLNPLAVEVGG